MIKELDAKAWEIMCTIPENRTKEDNSHLRLFWEKHAQCDYCTDIKDKDKLRRFPCYNGTTIILCTSCLKKSIRNKESEFIF
jgi:hypothetical protein